MEKFQKLGLNQDLLKAIKELGFEEPSEIQEKSIPLVLTGKDVIGKSATGSGKTLAFGSGIIQNLEKGDKVQALVLTPTRELAEQVCKSLKVFAKHSKLKVIEVYGGVPIERQIHEIRKADVVVGTPGRILDHIKRETLNLDGIKFLVLDEADRMVDMGFLPDVEKIINFCPVDRQTLLFSATITRDIDYISNKYMKSPKYISVESYVDPSKLKQVFYDVPTNIKFSLLVHLLKKDKSELVMVFCNTRRNSDLIAQNLRRVGLHAVSIHGGLTQNRRSNIMKDFHAGEINILVCTDVAARGLDIKGISHVYNYDIPSSSEDYIHRIGRTARAGKEGEAISLVTSKDYENFRRVLSDSSIKIEKKEIPEMEKIEFHYIDDKSKKERRFGGRGGKPRFRDRGDSRRDSRRFGGRRGPKRDDRRSFSRGRRGEGRSSRGEFNSRRDDSSRGRDSRRSRRRF